MNNGEEKEIVQGEVALIPPGHDGWTIGNEPVSWLELKN